MFIAYSAIVIDPSYVEIFSHADEREMQRILPNLILDKTPFWAQAIFFGALVSAILSTASGTLLAPSSLFVENVLRPFFPNLNEKNMLGVLRVVLVVFAACATLQAVRNNSTIYEMVQGAYSVVLVGALVPLALGVFWRPASTQGAMISIFSGVGVWLLVLFVFTDFIVPPQLCGLAASLVGMIVGSLIPQFHLKKQLG